MSSSLELNKLNKVPNFGTLVELRTQRIEHCQGLNFGTLVGDMVMPQIDSYIERVGPPFLDNHYRGYRSGNLLSDIMAARTKLFQSVLPLLLCKLSFQWIFFCHCQLLSDFEPSYLEGSIQLSKH